MEHTRRPEIWLQWDDNEARGIGDCGCELVQNYMGSGAALFYCNTHTAAPELLEAREARGAAHDEEPPMLTEAEWAAARAAIAKAKQNQEEV